jgi:succinate dehydrogenase (ubiquinone) cytochrome b560 subunit
MALSSLRLAARPFLLTQQSFIIGRWAGSTATSTSAHGEMKKFWQKNIELGRPNSPWVIYKPHLPMLTSLAHRVTGITMGVVLYGASIAVFAAPGDFPSYVEFIKNLHLSPMILFPAKTIAAFPLIYHYINGIRHLTWDAGHGYELKTQYKSGTIIVTTSILLSAMFASMAYW